LKKFFLAFGLAIAFSGHASATIIGGSVTEGTALAAGGTFAKLTVPLANPFGPPNSVGSDTFQSPNLFGFDEDQNIVLTVPLVVDVGSSPLPIGTIVASHYVFFHPGPSQTIIGTVDFDADLIAIITFTTNLANSDFLANTGVNYLSPGLRGLEPGDSVTIRRRSPDPLQYNSELAWRLRSRFDGVLPGGRAGTSHPRASRPRPSGTGSLSSPEAVTTIRFARAPLRWGFCFVKADAPLVVIGWRQHAVPAHFSAC